MNDHRKGSEMDNAEGELSVIKSPGVSERAGGGGLFLLLILYGFFICLSRAYHIQEVQH